MYIKPNEETADSIIEHATNQDHLQHKFSKFRNDFQLKDAIYGHMIQFPAEDDVLLKMSSSKLVEYISVVDISDDVPLVYEEYGVRNKIIEFLESIKFDSLQGSICIISPFIGLYRSIIVEVFLLDAGLKVLHSFAESDDELTIDSYIDEFESVKPTAIDSSKGVELIEDNSVSKAHSEITEMVEEVQQINKPGKLW